MAKQRHRLPAHHADCVAGKVIPTQYQQFRPLADRAPSRYRGPRQTTRGRAARIVGGATGVPDLGFRLRPIFTGVR